MRCLVVDDEPLARARLVRMLEQLGHQVAGEASDGRAALDAVRALDPDVVLLDIRMPELDGLALAALRDLPPIVFVTAWAEHAVEAFEVAAVDYLLKPVRRERLAEALSRVTVARAPVGRLAVRRGGMVRFVEIGAVRRIRAVDKVSVFELDGVEQVLDESLVELEARLDGFFRVHRSELVALARIVALHRDGGVEIELDDGQRVPVSRRRVAALEARLGLR